jgi:hypothetical protein
VSVDGESHGARNSGVLVSVLVLVLLAFGFLAYVPTTATSSSAVTSVSTGESTIVTSSTTVVQSTETTNQTQQVWVEVDGSLAPAHHDSYPASLPQGAEVLLSWAGNEVSEHDPALSPEAVAIYVFNSTEFVAYNSSGGVLTTPNVANGSSPDGDLEFRVPSAATYYLVVENPNAQMGGSNANEGVTVFGSVTQASSVVTQSTQTVTYTTSTETLSTITLTTTTTTSCSHYLWEWLLGAKSCA